MFARASQRLASYALRTNTAQVRQHLAPSRSSASLRSFATNARENSSSRLGVLAFGVASIGAVGAWLYDKNSHVAEAAVVVDKKPTQPVTTGKGTPQSTVVTGNHSTCGICVVHLTPNADVRKIVRACANLKAIAKEATPEDLKPLNGMPHVMAGVGFGTKYWEKVCKTLNIAEPADLVAYKTRRGKYGTMPATGGEIVIHVKTETHWVAVEIIKQFLDSLPAGSIEKFDDRYGFGYTEGRDLSGFLDGTENPAMLEDRKAAALAADSSSYLIHQRWAHKIAEFSKRTVEDQENVVGRTKPDSAELDPLPACSHVARMRDGNGIKIPIVRQSMPFGELAQQHGLLFIAYANTPAKFDRMLDRMTGNDKGKDGLHNDDIMSFSDNVAGQYFFVPSEDLLARSATL